MNKTPARLVALTMIDEDVISYDSRAGAFFRYAEGVVTGARRRTLAEIHRAALCEAGKAGRLRLTETGKTLLTEWVA